MPRPAPRSPEAIQRDLEAAYYLHERKVVDAEEELRRPGISASYRSELQKIRADSLAELEWLDERMKQGHAPNGGYYVWVMGRGDAPLDEPALGPYPLGTAKTMARIAATEGVHDRAVSLGVSPLASSFQIVRRYRAHSGERIV